MRIGIHVSIAGSLERAALTAHSLGANTMQIFSASPRMWRPGTLDPADVRRFRRARARLGLAPLVVHDNYLINLASADAGIRARSIAAFRGELERARRVGADYLVAHPGNSKGQSLDSALETLAASLTLAARSLRLTPLTLLLENTAGSGSAIGSRFEELARIRELAARRTHLGIGYCLDTAHLLAAGYDIHSAAGLERTLAEADRILGLENVPVFHANDSKAAPGSRVDRHEQIGRGHVGAAAFRRLLHHPRLRDKAFILETPVADEGDDRRNVQRLWKLSV